MTAGDGGVFLAGWASNFGTFTVDASGNITSVATKSYATYTNAWSLVVYPRINEDPMGALWATETSNDGYVVTFSISADGLTFGDVVEASKHSNDENDGFALSAGWDADNQRHYIIVIGKDDSDRGYSKIYYVDSSTDPAFDLTIAAASQEWGQSETGWAIGNPGNIIRAYRKNDFNDIWIVIGGPVWRLLHIEVPTEVRVYPSDPLVRVTGIVVWWDTGPDKIYQSELLLGGLFSQYFSPVSPIKEPEPTIPEKRQLRPPPLPTLREYGQWLKAHTEAEQRAILSGIPGENFFTLKVWQDWVIRVRRMGKELP